MVDESLGLDGLREPAASVTIELDPENGEIRIQRETAFGTVTERIER